MTIFTGRTVEEAIARGLYRLGVKRENVHIHVKQKEKRVSTSPHLSPQKLPSGCCKLFTNCTIRSMSITSNASYIVRICQQTKSYHCNITFLHAKIC